MKKIPKHVLFSGGPFVTLGVLLVFFVIPRFDHVAFDAAEATDLNTTPTKTSIEASTKVSPMSKVLASEDHIWTLCPVEQWAHDYKDDYADFDSQISEKCFEAVGNYLTQFPRKLGWWYLPRLLVISNPMTYDRVFADPKTDRSRVLDALSRPECQFQEGELIRWDLKDDCHGVAFANYANFLSLCGSPSYLTTWHEENDILGDALVNFDDPWEDFEVRKVLFQRDLEQEWVYKQCRNFGIENRLFDHEGQDRDIFRLLNLVGENVGEESIENPEGNLQAEVQRVLIALAARFGEEWAILEYRGPKILTDSWDLWINKEQPWREFRNLYPVYDPPSVEKVTAAVDFILAMEDADVRFDWDMFVTDLCLFDEDDSLRDRTCESSMESLSLKLEPDQHARHIEVIAQLKQVAQRLGVYANPFPIDRSLRRLYEYSYDQVASGEVQAQ